MEQPKPIPHRMNERRISEAKDFAERLWRYKRQHGISHDGFYVKDNKKQIHEDAVVAEWTVADYFDWKVNDDIQKRGDEGWDMVAANGLRVDVKHRSQQGYDILFPHTMDKFIADIALLTWPSNVDDEYLMMGWTTRVHAAIIGRMEHIDVESYLIPWKELRDMQTMLPIFRGRTENR